MAQVPPHDLNAEMTVLGACLFDPKALASIGPTLRPRHFYREANGRIWEAMLAQWQTGLPVDVGLVAEDLRRCGVLEEVGGRSYLMSLADAVPTGATVPYHARLIREKAQRRDFIRVLEDATARGYADHGPLLEEITNLQGGLLGVVGASAASRTLTPQEFARLLEQAEPQRGLPTGISVIDDHCGGLVPGHMIVIAGRPRMGKTTILLQVAAGLAFTGHPILFCSIEMSALEIGWRLLGQRGPLTAFQVRSQPKGERDQALLAQVASSGFHIDDRAAPRLSDLTAAIRAWKSTYDIEAIFVDHIGKIVPPRADTRSLEIGAIARSLKETAKDLRLPIVAACQLNRAVEGRNDPRPFLADLRESGEIEQEADEVLFLWSEADQYDRATKPILPMWVTLAKNRHGPEGEVRMNFHRANLRFE